MNLSFPPVFPEDLNSIFLLNKDLIDLYEDTASIDYEQVLSWVNNNIQEQFPHFRRILADGDLAGYFALVPSGDSWELDSLFVLPAYQGKGIGTQVLKHCIHESDGQLFLYVFRKNTGAERLYSRMGFVPIKEAGKTRLIMKYEKQGCTQ